MTNETAKARSVTVRTVASEQGLRYLDWVKSRMALVEKLSDGKVGYVHLPDTALAGNRMLQKLFYSQAGKPALLVDDRYNGGEAFKLCIRDERGVIATVIADNYFGYCKKEVKTQISMSANLFGTQFAAGLLKRPFWVMTSFMLVFFGIQFICMGILAEIQIRTYHESQGKPIYVIREIIESEPQ